MLGVGAAAMLTGMIGFRPLRRISGLDASKPVTTARARAESFFILFVIFSSLFFVNIVHSQEPDIQIVFEYNSPIELEKPYNIRTILINDGDLFAFNIEVFWDFPSIGETDQPIFSIQPIERYGPEELWPGENITIVWEIIGHETGEYVIGFYVKYYDMLNNQYITPSPPEPTIAISVIASPQEQEPAIPGFPFEAIMLGITVAVVAIYMLRKRKTQQPTTRALRCPSTLSSHTGC
jgi:hypothetical protein